MHKLYDLKEKLCKELEEYAERDITASSLDVIAKLAQALKNVEKIIGMGEEAEGEYSNRGGSYRYMDGVDHEYGRGMVSYRDGSYARGRRNAPRDAMGRYSGEGYSRHGDMAEQLRQLMHDAPDEETRREIERLASKVERG